jgi:hypothetical protein
VASSSPRTVRVASREARTARAAPPRWRRLSSCCTSACSSSCSSSTRRTSAWPFLHRSAGWRPDRGRFPGAAAGTARGIGRVRRGARQAARGGGGDARRGDAAEQIPRLIAGQRHGRAVLPTPRSLADTRGPARLPAPRSSGRAPHSRCAPWRRCAASACPRSARRRRTSLWPQRCPHVPAAPASCCLPPDCWAGATRCPSCSSRRTALGRWAPSRGLRYPPAFNDLARERGTSAAHQAHSPCTLSRFTPPLSLPLALPTWTA